uniref:Uncharacterized protein n=1 Tax=Anguilla anguilla TaxID=7936 RepID=A0A0E9XG02_ANGAN
MGKQGNRSLSWSETAQPYVVDGSPLLWLGPLSALTFA